ncbi:MAG: hypothetical protein ACRDHZ_04020 [Ktedonobacteraceae bacterium]
MDDLIDGTIKGWPVLILIDHDPGSRVYGLHCHPYTNGNDASAPKQTWDICYEIAIEGSPLSPC